MKRKPYWKMTPRELAEATKQFDEPLVADQSRPLTTAEREQWNRLRRKGDGPKASQKLRRVSVSIEQGLLERVTALARKRRVSRSKLLADAIRDAMAHER